MKLITMPNLFYIVIICLILNSLSMDLSSEILETLNNDHLRMKGFKENYRRMSCKLLVTSRLRAMYETEELDHYTNKTTPEARPKFLDRYRNDLLEHCLKHYKEDKIIFQDQLFYSYPQDDREYRGLLSVNITEILLDFPVYVQPEQNTTNVEKPSKPAKNRTRHDDL